MSSNKVKTSAHSREATSEGRGVSNTNLVHSAAIDAAVPPVIAQFLQAMNVPVANAQFVQIDDLDRLADDFKKSHDAELSIRLWRGANLLALSQARKGDFKGFLKQIGMTHRSAYEHIQIVTTLGQLQTVDRVRTCALLDFSKLREVTAWSYDDLNAFASGEPVRGMTLEQAAEMSFRDFKEAEQQWKREHNEQLNRLESENVRLKERLEMSAKLAKDVGRLEAKEAIPAFAREVREEAMFVSEQMMVSLQLLEDSADQGLFDLRKAVQSADQMRWQPATARTLYHALATPVARALALMQRAKALYGEAPDGSVVLDSQLEPSELKRFETYRDHLLPRMQQEKAERDDERANSAAGKRGRPRGTGKGKGKS